MWNAVGKAFHCMRRTNGPQGRPQFTSVVSPSLSPSLVIDTNVVLDWLLFDDPRARALADAVTARRVRWMASLAMRTEIERVLARGIASRPGHATDAIVESFDRWAVRVDQASGPLSRSLRCSDGDDQKFIDLALQANASALISRDRAVLRLARAAAPLGLRIVVPERWDV